MASRNGKGWNIKNSTWQKLGRMSAKELEKKASANMYLAKQAFAKNWNKAGARSAHWAKILYAQAQRKKAFGIQTKTNNAMRKYF